MIHLAIVSRYHFPVETKMSLRWMIPLIVDPLQQRQSISWSLGLDCVHIARPPATVFYNALYLTYHICRIQLSHLVQCTTDLPNVSNNRGLPHTYIYIHGFFRCFFFFYIFSFVLSLFCLCFMVICLLCGAQGARYYEIK